jgi:class 3 adenylate cyclase/GAF domain-containing protein
MLIKIPHFFEKRFSRKRNLYYKLNIVFGLFFLFPVAGIIFFGIRYNVLNDEYIPIYFLGLLTFSLIGFNILKKLFDTIVDISAKVSSNSVAESGASVTNTDELYNIVRSFTDIEAQFRTTFRQLEKKASEISILKELSDLCYVTFDPEEILYITLERALSLTRSDIGSILGLEKTEPKSFVVKTTVGLGKLVKVGDCIDFESSIAKYAVINKSPLVVKDIEKDSRFGRANLPHYGTKSFVCMPIKTSKEIIGVLTLSRKDTDQTYSQEDVEALTPLLSNAAFTYENLRLLKELDKASRYAKTSEKISKILNSSFRDTELLRAVLNEIHSVVAFSRALVLVRDPGKSGCVRLWDIIASEPSTVAKGASFELQGSVLEKIFKQETMVMVEDTRALEHGMDQELFAGPDSAACLFAPWRSEGAVSGILALTATHSRIFLDFQDLIKWVADGLSLAIERNSLSAVVVKRNQELDTIRQIGSALASSTFDINKVLKYTMDVIRELMNVEAGSLLLLQNGELEFAVAFNIKIKSMKKVRLKMGQGIAGYVAARGETIIVNDTEKSPHFFPVVDEVSGFNTRSALCVPMISQGQVTGVIEVLNKVGGDFDENDKDLLQSIASSVSIALENARLYKETLMMAEHERDLRRMFQKFVPKEVLDKIINDSETGRPIVEELKTLTILNIDIRKFSALARRIGSQKTVALLNRFFAGMGSIVFKHHGIVDKYLGDGFLAVFGAPVSSTSDADNAVSAALDMQASLSALNAGLQKTFGASLEVGIAVHTGEVVVGNIGFEKKMDYTVIGDAVNTVFRLQVLTKPFPNGILLSEKTLRATRARLDVEELEIPVELTQSLSDMRVFRLLSDEPKTAFEPAEGPAVAQPAVLASPGT